MKKIIKFIRQRIDWFLIVVGSYIVMYGIFNFEITEKPPVFVLSTAKVRTIYAYGYFYPPEVTLTIALGVALLVLGILIYKEKAKK